MEVTKEIKYKVIWLIHTGVFNFRECRIKEFNTKAEAEDYKIFLEQAKELLQLPHDLNCKIV